MKNSLTNFLKVADAKHDINFHTERYGVLRMPGLRAMLGRGGGEGGMPTAYNSKLKLNWCCC